jgi:hypothetical protein
MMTQEQAVKTIITNITKAFEMFAKPLLIKATPEQKQELHDMLFAIGNDCWNHGKAQEKLFHNTFCTRDFIRNEAIEEAKKIFQNLHDSLDNGFDKPEYHKIRSFIGIKFDIFEGQLEALKDKEVGK